MKLFAWMAFAICVGTFAVDEPKLTPDEIRYVKEQYHHSVSQALNKSIGAYAGTDKHENGGWIIGKDNATWIRSTHGGIVTETYSFDPITDIALSDDALVIRLTFREIKTELGDKYIPDKNDPKIILRHGKPENNTIDVADFNATDDSGNPAHARMVRDETGSAEKYQAQASKRAQEYPDEQHAVEVAKAEFKRRFKNDGKDSEFSASKEKVGWCVVISDKPHMENGQLVVIPGGCAIFLDNDWKVTKVQGLY